MTTTPAKATPQLLQAEWIPFSGGELEAPRPRVLCPDCRRQLQSRVNGRVTAAPADKALCFQCYRTALERDKAIAAAANLDTGSAERFQVSLPLEPVNHARLARLKVERQEARRIQAVASPYVDRRRRAQINARHALQGLAAGLRAYREKQEQRRVAAIRTGEMMLPDAWLPFAASR